MLAASVAGCAQRARVPGDAHPAELSALVDDARIVVRYEPGEERAGRDVLAAAPDAVRRARRWGPLAAATFVVHGSEESFRAAVGETGRTALRAWTRYDVVHLRSPRAWGPLGASEGELAEILAHELVHCVTDQRLGDREAWSRRPLPFWFREGMAMDVADPELDRAIRARLRTFEARRVPPPGESALARAEQLLSEHPDLAYATAFVAFGVLVDGAGEQSVGLILDRVRAGTSFADAFAAEVGRPLGAFDADVRRAILAAR
jgi:hypothetical protein